MPPDPPPPPEKPCAASPSLRLPCRRIGLAQTARVNAPPISPGNFRSLPDVVLDNAKRTFIMRSGCLWMLGVPIPIIILLWFLTGSP